MTSDFSYWPTVVLDVPTAQWRNLHLCVSELTHNTCTLNDLKAQGFRHSMYERKKALRRGRKKVEQLQSFGLYIFRHRFRSLQVGYFQNAVCFPFSSRISDLVLSQHLERRQIAIFLSTHQPGPATQTLWYGKGLLRCSTPGCFNRRRKRRVWR